jgi:phage host-nuclease inhibitor protein Gam
MTITEAWNDLESDLLGEAPDYDQPPSELPDLDAVNRELRRVAKIRRDRVTYEELAEAEMVRLRAALDARREHFARMEQWHLDRLRRYHEAALSIDPKAKTVQLPNGTLKARAGQPRWESETDTFVEWARAHGAADLLRVTYAPDKVAVKNRLAVSDDHAVTADGEIGPGVTVSPADTSFTVDTSEVE